MVEPVTMGSVGAFGLVLKGLQAIKDVAVSVEVKGKVSDLYGVILAGQQSAMEENIKQHALVEEIRELKEQITRMEAWDAEKQRYVLAQPWSGTIVYALKEFDAAGEPAHYICANCYIDGRKSMLNAFQDATRNGFTSLRCRCNAQVPTPYRGPVGYRYAEQIFAAPE